MMQRWSRCGTSFIGRRGNGRAASTCIAALRSLHSFTLDGDLRAEPDAAELHDGMAWSADGKTFFFHTAIDAKSSRSIILLTAASFAIGGLQRIRVIEDSHGFAVDVAESPIIRHVFGHRHQLRKVRSPFATAFPADRVGRDEKKLVRIRAETLGSEFTHGSPALVQRRMEVELESNMSTHVPAKAAGWTSANRRPQL
jgi:hypothetical protein